ncbi:HigA family addiction module antidote protein [Methylobacterium sp. 2A]|jgi:antitoxin HigA-1|uniref:HigA family addiction module antitoxin n=2 Tax=unclassified Methylobacterium TaxID=2615210 RepID=UPI0013561326|nr:HigA family addiction module antitoxin [Methylobacterium sp. 2A]MWV24052.1 HigA family addiction module antidote protein [Methylobacterium sp. 2A]
MSGDPLLSGLAPMHPGEWLREMILPAIGLAKAEIARRLGVSRQTLYDLIAERQPVTPAMALRLGKLFGNEAEFWLDLQQAYDLRLLEAQMAEELAGIVTLKAA